MTDHLRVMRQNGGAGFVRGKVQRGRMDASTVAGLPTRDTPLMKTGDTSGLTLTAISGDVLPPYEPPGVVLKR